MSGVIQQFPVEKEFEKNPDISPDDIRKLREWLMSQPHLPGKQLSANAAHRCRHQVLMKKNLKLGLDLDIMTFIGPDDFGWNRKLGRVFEHGVFWFGYQTVFVGVEISLNTLYDPGSKRADLLLIITYHCCDRSVEVTKQVLDLHITARTLLTSIFKDRVVDKNIIDIMKVVYFIPLYTVRGYRALYCGLLDGDARKYNFTYVIRTAMMMLDLLQYEEGSWPGFVLVINMNMVNMGHVAKVDVVVLRQVLYFLQQCMLVKLKEVHFCNAPSFMDKVMLLMKPFINKSLLDIIHIHESDSKVFYKYVLKESLPKDCGGDYKDLKTLTSENIHRMENNKDFFKNDNIWMVNESLRPNGKSTPVQDIFGIQGSFKKLDID